MRRLKKNNKGFSLVELIAAVAILAVVVTPLLHSFVTSTKISYRASEISQTTLAAKNILETVDARPISEFQVESNDNAASQLLSSEKAVKITPIGVYDDQNRIKTDNGNFEFVLQNVMAGNSFYDAKVELTRGDANENQKDENNQDILEENGEAKKSTSHGLYLINDEELAKYSGMDAVFAQSYIKTANPDMLAEDAYNTQKKLDDARRLDAENSGETVAGGLPSRNRAVRHRTIELTVIKKNDGRIYATVTYFYEFTFTSYSSSGLPYDDTWGGIENSHTRFKYSLFPGGYIQPQNKEDGSVSVFIMFYPETGSTNENPINDRIIINNFGYDSYDVNLKVFLYKQYPMEYDAENNTYNEASVFPSVGYKPLIRIYKPESYEIYNDDNNAKRETLIYTNIDQGMPEGTFPDFGVANVSVDPEEFISYDPDDPDSVFNPVYGFVNNNYANSFDLVRKEKEIRIYNVKITLYKKGSAVIEKEGKTASCSFSSKPIYTVEGSKTP